MDSNSPIEELVGGIKAEIFLEVVSNPKPRKHENSVQFSGDLILMNRYTDMRSL